MMRDKVTALVLAGGQGTRLGKLTKRLAKPAVPFGGKYRIIDFTLSNLANSNMNQVGVITQYEPYDLNQHIGNGEDWGMNGENGGVSILQPYTDGEGTKWFEGTAHAIYQNMSYIDRQDPEYVIILSGDHIYKMDYDEMLDYHKAHNAALTVAVLPVAWEEAPRFGIMNTDPEHKITAFVEKPAQPESNLASMGIYIFNWQKLRQYLINGFNGHTDFTDFGKHVIPAYLQNDEAVYAYAFEGYWRDVGTIKSLWQANMALLEPGNKLNLSDHSWPIYAKNEMRNPMLIDDGADVSDSLVVEAEYVDGKIRHSVVSGGAIVAEDAVIEHSVVMPGAKILAGAHVSYAIIGENAIVGKDVTIVGTEEKIAVVGCGDVEELNSATIEGVS
jgi:glucose-1-phosphate adenylyltransferase